MLFIPILEKDTVHILKIGKFLQEFYFAKR